MAPRPGSSCKEDGAKVFLDSKKQSLSLKINSPSVSEPRVFHSALLALGFSSKTAGISANCSRFQGRLGGGRWRRVGGERDTVYNRMAVGLEYER